MRTQQYGGGCINEVCVHMMVKGVPFNGTGHSGMGAYHGEWGFREFTHPQTVLTGKTHANLPLREHPYSGKNEKPNRAAMQGARPKPKRGCASDSIYASAVAADTSRAVKESPGMSGLKDAVMREASHE